MRATTIIGIVLIILGIVGFLVGGFSYTHEKKDIDMGPVQVRHEERRTVPISPIASGVAVVAGVILVIAGTRKGT